MRIFLASHYENVTLLCLGGILFSPSSFSNARLSIPSLIWSGISFGYTSDCGRWLSRSHWAVLKLFVDIPFVSKLFWLWLTSCDFRNFLCSTIDLRLVSRRVIVLRLIEKRPRLISRFPRIFNIGSAQNIKDLSINKTYHRLSIFDGSSFPDCCSPACFDAGTVSCV